MARMVIWGICGATGSYAFNKLADFKLFIIFGITYWNINPLSGDKDYTRR